MDKTVQTNRDNLDMNETIVTFDSKKRLKLVLYGLVITVLAALFAYYIFFVAEKIRLFHGILMFVMSYLGFCFLFAGIKSLFDNDRIGLLLDAEGIRYKGTPIGKKIGIVKWNAIQSLSTGAVHGVNFVFLKLRNPEDYMHDLPPQLQQHVTTNGIVVSDDQLSLDFNELQKLIEEYHQWYSI